MEERMEDIKVISKIIYSDEYFLAIDKPAGLVVHSDGRTDEKSLVDWIKISPTLFGKEGVAQEQVGNPHTLDSGRYASRWGIMNRLDRETSGIILIAKDEDTFVNLQKQFMGRIVKKEYIAEVYGLVDENMKITEPLSRHKKDPRIWVCGSGVGERLSKREAETILEFINYNEKENKSLIKLFPITGRTHQLRLHCRFIGHPIVGDKKYGINGIANEHGVEQIKNLLEHLDPASLQDDKNSRLMLHAHSLEFLHPHTNQKVKIETQLPEEFIF